jgi:tetratricopeptide (TPR) repeat protein
MITTPQKAVKEHLARAKSYLTRDAVLKSVSTIVVGLEHMIRNRIMGKDRYEVEVHIGEYLREFNRHPLVKEYFMKKNIHATPYVKFVKGKEKELLTQFEGLERDMRSSEKKAEESKGQKKEGRKQELLDKGQDLLDKGEHARGKGFLRRAAEGYGDEPGVIVDVGMRMFKAGLTFEASQVLEKSIEKHPTDPKGYAALVQTYAKLAEYAKCENVYLMAIKQFGGHPKTHLNLAKVYVKLKNYDKAYDYAKKALEQQPDLEEAGKIVKKMEARIFTSGGGGFKA